MYVVPFDLTNQPSVLKGEGRIEVYVPALNI